MSNWIIHFLISNIFICIFTLVIIGTKKLLKKYLSATTQYHLCFLLFLLLAVPFFFLYRFMAHNFFHGYIFSN